jgi:hypothetical protein
MTFVDKDGNVVATGEFAVFDKVNRSNGRIYDKESYIKHLREYEIKLQRELRVKKIQKINKLNE